MHRQSIKRPQRNIRAANLALWICTALLPVAAAAQQMKIVGYFTEDGAASGTYLVKDVASSGAASMLATLNYAFGRVSNGRCEIDDTDAALRHTYKASESVDGIADLSSNGLRGTFLQLQKLKLQHPNLKVVISLGGWGGSSGFSQAAEPAQVETFVRSCVQTFILGRFAPGIDAPGIFDGIDIDWEYPVAGGPTAGRPEDKQRFTAMVAEFRRQLDAVRPGLLLTAALPARPEDYRHFELSKLSPYLDQISIMAYDLHWSTEPLTNFHSAMFHLPGDPSQPPLDRRYGDQAVQAFLAAGIPPGKLLLGIPFYGKAWQGVGPANHGLYQAGKPGNEDSGTYRLLKALPPSADRQFDAQAASCSVLYRSNFWTYDCPQAMRVKRKYIRQQNLGGAMFWELSQDTPDLELLRSLAGQEKQKSPDPKTEASDTKTNQP